MRIEKLIVKDFRSHALTKVGFSTGINLIIGQNGSGKSSLLDAILVGLYWPAKPRDLKKDDFSRIGGGGTEITVFFEKGNVKYQIHRNIARGIAFVKYHDGSSWKTLETGQRQVREWMEKMVPYDVFLNAIYIRQGEIDAILESDESREKVVRQVLGLDKYENTYKNLLDVRKEIDARIKAIESYLRSTENLDDLIGNLEGELTSVLREINELSPNVPRLRKELEELENELKELEEKAEELSKIKLKLKEVEGLLRELEARKSGLLSRVKEEKKRVEKLREKVEELREIEPKARDYQKLSNFLREFEMEMNRIEKLLASHSQQVENLEERLAELKDKRERIKALAGEREEIEKELEGLKSDVDAYQRARELEANFERLRKRLTMSEVEIGELETEINSAKKRKEEITREIEEIGSKKGELRSRAGERNRAIVELKKARGKCPVCGRELTEEHRKKLLEKYTTELKEISDEMKGLDERERKLRAELVEIEKILKREKELFALKEVLGQIREIEEKLKGYDFERLEKANKRAEELKKKLSEIEGKIRELEGELKKAESLKKKLEIVKRKIEGLESEKKSLLGSLEEFGFGSAEEARAKLKELEPYHNRYIELKPAEEELKHEEEMLNDLTLKLNAVRAEIAGTEKKLESLRKKMGDAEKGYNKDRHEELKEKARKASTELAALEARLKTLEERREEIKGNLEKLMRERKTREDKTRELENLKKARERVQRLREKVKAYKNLLKEGALGRVGEMASEIFEELTEEKYSGVTVKAEENRVRLGVVYNGKEYGLGFLSGGERIALGLAFRLALSLYLAGEISLLILDEPTPYLDEERRRRLVDIMQRYLRKIPQVIVVSHDEELKDAADRVVRVSLENDISVVREVEVG
ncbi:DNA double-strand break repair ATPase Rad50, partial [Thermococcus sp.]|uniref:DNA double-strand break repair ATPase Rad50 n=1 Tax=Thermococcus sp. TaxID=35749 RepID=UPI00261A7EE8